MSSVFARALTMIAVVLQSYIGNKENEVGKVDNGNDASIGSSAAYHLAGLVLARGGSKGIVRKNLVEIQGQPLIGRALNSMIESGVFTSIWVSTDDQEIHDWVRSQYPKDHVAIHNRAAYTATDTATSMTAVLEFMALHPEVDAIGLVQATSPFLKPEYLKEAASQLLRKDGRYDSIFSATRSHQLRWSAVDSSKYTVSLNFNRKSRPRRQDWEGEMVENGMFYFAFRSVIVNYQVFQSDRSGYVEIPKHLSLEVDSYHDLKIARCLAIKFDQEKDPDQSKTKRDAKVKEGKEEL